MDSIKKIDKKWLILGAVLVLGLLWFSFSGSGDDATSGDSSPGETYSVESADGKVVGSIEIGSTYGDGDTQYWYTFLINDNVPNNGYCQSNDPNYCDSQATKDNESRNYRYGTVIAGTEGTDGFAASTYEPVYCNLDVIQSDLTAASINSDVRTDITCDAWDSTKWQPTEWFLVRNGATTTDLDALLQDLTLDIYDIADEFVIEVSDGGSTITSGVLDYANITNNELIHSFDIDVIE